MHPFLVAQHRRHQDDLRVGIRRADAVDQQASLLAIPFGITPPDIVHAIRDEEQIGLVCEQLVEILHAIRHAPTWDRTILQTDFAVRQRLQLSGDEFCVPELIRWNMADARYIQAG